MVGSDDTLQIYHADTGPISVKHEKSLLEGHDKGDLFNDFGFVVRAKADTGEDIHLWSFIYQQRGDEIVVDGDVGQTLLVYGNYTDEQKTYMHPDCPNVNQGQNIEDYYPPGSCEIDDSHDDHVTWKLGGRVHYGETDKWRVSGEHAGVKCDIEFEQYNPAFFHCGTFEDLGSKQPQAGHIVHCKTKGTIEVHGKVLKFSGFGIHERIIQYGKIPDRTGYMSGRGLHWMHGFSDGFTWYLLRGDVGKGMSSAMINLGNKQIVLENPTGSGVEEVAQWVDPLSKIVSPYKWRVWIQTPEGKLESHIYAYGRAYYTWIRRGGTLVVNQYCANAESSFTYPDGKVIEAKQLISIEHMRTLYRQMSSLTK